MRHVMSAPVLHHHLSILPWMSPARRRLPGLSSVTPERWLIRDECFSGQMARRDALIADNRDTVFQVVPGLEAAAGELAKSVLDLIINYLRRDFDYAIKNESVRRPDNVLVHRDTDHPLVTAGRLIQEDLALMVPSPDTGNHQLAAGLVCFPASWTLGEKMGRSLTALHAPVTAYDAPLANRTERIFGNLPVGKIIERGNYLVYTDPTLHQPRREGVIRHLDPGAPRYVRVERQTLRRVSRGTLTGLVFCHPYQRCVRGPFAALRP